MLYQLSYAPLGGDAGNIGTGPAPVNPHDGVKTRVGPLGFLVVRLDLREPGQEVGFDAGRDEVTHVAAEDAEGNDSQGVEGQHANHQDQDKENRSLHCRTSARARW